MIDLNPPCRWNLRIWDDDKHEWLCDKNDDALPYYGFDIRGGEVTALQGMDSVYRNFYRRNFIWEQSTGLKDKNGKEIYEGDIVKMPDWQESPRYEIVKYHKAGFDPFQEGCLECWSADGEEVEVVGNINENPELLEGDDE